MSREAFVTQLSFHFSPASGHILPLQTIRERIRGIWESLTWPIVKRILKADLAVTILFALLLVEPIRERAEYGIILAQVAAEFIHPAKSYGALGEVCLIGSIVVGVRFVWSIITDVLMLHMCKHLPFLFFFRPSAPLGHSIWHSHVQCCHWLVTTRHLLCIPGTSA